MKYYELAYLITPVITEEELKGLTNKISAFISDEQGVVDRIFGPSKRRLGSPIKKQQEGFLVSLDFHLAAEKMENLEKKMKIEEQILRHIIITKKVLKKDAFERQRNFIKKVPRVAEKTFEPKKAELKEIDQKLEEILGEQLK